MLQPLYNLSERQKFETEYLPLTQKHNMGVVTYYSLASGFLTGKYRGEKDLQKGARGSSVGKYMNHEGMRILQALDRVAEDTGSTPAAVALAWLMHKPGVTAPIASATRAGHIADFNTAAELTLSSEQMQDLDTASAYSPAGVDKS